MAKSDVVVTLMDIFAPCSDPRLAQSGGKGRSDQQHKVATGCALNLAASDRLREAGCERD